MRIGEIEKRLGIKINRETIEGNPLTYALSEAFARPSNGAN